MKSSLQLDLKLQLKRLFNSDQSLLSIKMSPGGPEHFQFACGVRLISRINPFYSECTLLVYIFEESIFIILRDVRSC